MVSVKENVHHKAVLRVISQIHQHEAYGLVFEGGVISENVVAFITNIKEPADLPKLQEDD